jgi:Fe-S cluster biogenesis protein NfuA
MNIPFSDEELFEAVTNILNGKITDYIKKDGGDIVLVKVQNSIIYVKLQGACVGCAGSTSTVKNIIQKEICRLIHPDLIVEQIK